MKDGDEIVNTNIEGERFLAHQSRKSLLIEHCLQGISPMFRYKVAMVMEGEMRRAEMVRGKDGTRGDKKKGKGEREGRREEMRRGEERSDELGKGRRGLNMERK